MSWRIPAVVAIAATMLACGSDEAPEREPAPRGREPATAVAPPVPEPPQRIAAGDAHLRTLLAELATARACERVRGQFRGLRGADRPDTVTGQLWIRDCKMTRQGREVTFHLSGHGWQWVEQRVSKAGARFAVQQYVRFAMSATIPGTVDIGYSPSSHVLSLWFTPSGAPDIEFTPVGGVDVDEKGAWSEIVGALGSVVGSSPERRAEKESKKHGSREFRSAFADGMSVTFDLCTGLSRFNLERPATGKMVSPDAGETRKVAIELQPTALAVFGPYRASDGMTVRVRARSGRVLTELMCKDDAESAAMAYIDRKPAPILRPLASKVVSGEQTLRVRRASCPVMVVARPASANAGPVVFDWRRPASEAARAEGGAVIDCADDKRNEHASR